LRTCTASKSFHALLRWYKKKPNLFTVLVWFFVNFARNVTLEIFDKSRCQTKSEAIHNIKHDQERMLILRKTKIKYP
jgi:hypothetical protein